MAENVRPKSFRELVVPSDSGTRWKEITVNTGASASTLQDIKVPDSCGGYSYLDSGTHQPSVTNRFIYWRTSNDVLELVEESLDYNLIGSHVRFRFLDTQIIGGISVHESHGNVIVLVVTVASVHRLVFPHPFSLERNDIGYTSVEHPIPSVFYDASLASVTDPRNMHLLNSTSNVTSQLQGAATYLNADGQALFTLCSNTGSILLVKMPPLGIQGVIQQFELSQSSMMQKLWSGLVPSVMRGGQESAEAITSMLLHPFFGTTYIFAVCRDHKMRVWSTKTHECITVYNLMECCLDLKNMQPVSGTGHSIRKVLNSDANNLMLCVHLIFQSRNQFCFIQPQHVNGRVQPFHVASMFGTQDDLIDYCVTELQLWTLWTNNDGESVSKVCTMTGQQIGNNWMDVIMHPSEETDIFVPSNLDPREVYIDRIFQPGRFSLHDIQKALNVYRRSLDTTALPDSAVQITSLKEEVTHTVEDAIRTAAVSNEISEEEYCQLQLDQWSKFHSCVVQYHEVGAKMKGLFADPVTGLVCFIKKGGIGYIRPCDRIEELYLGSGQWQEADGSRNLDDSLKRDITTLGMCLRLISGRVTPDMQYEYQAMLNEGIDNITDELLLNISLTDELDTTEALANLVQTVHDLPGALQVVLGTMNLMTPEEDMEEEGMEMQHHLSCNQLFSSFTGLSLLTATIQQMSQTGLSALWDLLLLQVSVVNLGEKSGITPQMADTLRRELIPLNRMLIQSYTVLKWSSLKVAPPSHASSIDRNSRQLATLEITDNSGLTNQQRTVSQNVTIMELFIRGVGGTQARTYLAKSRQLEDEPRMSWTLGVLGIVQHLTQILWPMNQNFLFPEFLVSCCHYLPLQEYIHRLDGWCEVNANSRRFMLGLCYLHSDEAQKSAICFMEAIEGLHVESFLRRISIQQDGNNLQVPDHDQIRKWEVLYYLQVIRLFEEFDCADVVVSLASSAIGVADNDANSPTLWSKLFKYQLELEHNEEAYHAMIDNPDPSRRKDCLRQLLVTLCERGDLQTIIEFQYTDLEDEVVSILESRARAVDISTQNYYDLLYAYYVSRSNFSKAAEVMYEHGMRLGRELPGKRGLQRQAQCYLAAMNALRIVKVNSPFAWIVKPEVDLKNSRNTRSVSDWSFYERDEKEEKEPKRKDVRILELRDIEKEYMLVDARLRLLKRETDPVLSSGPTPGADEMVGLLVNAGMYDRAIIICQMFDMKLTPVFESLALRCVNLAKSMTHSTLTDNTVLSLAWDWLQENHLTGSKESSVSDTAWMLLQTYLDNYKEDNTAQYHKCVVIKLLSHGFPLPSWLVNSYKKLNWSELLRLYTDFDMLEDAVILTMEAVDALLNTFCGNHSPHFDMRSCPNPPPQCGWLPYTCIDQLLQALGEHSNILEYQELYENLEQKLMTYNRKIDHLSQCLLDR